VASLDETGNAAAAGLLRGDRLLAVNGLALLHLTQEQIARALSTAHGPAVRLLVQRLDSFQYVTAASFVCGCFCMCRYLTHTHTSLARDCVDGDAQRANGTPRGSGHAAHAAAAPANV
jgi:hypothetical protein